MKVSITNEFFGPSDDPIFCTTINLVCENEQDEIDFSRFNFCRTGIIQTGKREHGVDVEPDEIEEFSLRIVRLEDPRRDAILSGIYRG